MNLPPVSSLIHLGILVLACSGAMGQDDVDEEQRRFALSPGASFSPPDADQESVDMPRLFQKFVGVQPADIIASLQRLQKEPGVVATTVVVVNRAAVNQGMVLIDLFDVSVVCLKTKQRKLDPAGSRTTWEFLVAAEGDTASFRHDASLGLRGKIVAGSRRWELVPLPTSDFALISFGPPPSGSGSPSGASMPEDSALFPPILKLSKGVKDRAAKFVATLSRTNVQQVDGFVRTPAPFLVDSTGFVQTLPGLGDVLVQRSDSMATGPDGAFQWNGCLFAGKANSGSFVATEVGHSGTLSFNGKSYEVRPLSGDLHVILQLDTTRFPDDESEEDQNFNP